jgi:hypothetical protein
MGASMSEYDERPKDENSWKKLYEAALLEFDPNLLPQRIAEAQKAIDERALALRANGDGNSEKEALENALVALGDLKRMRTDACHMTDPISRDWRDLCAAVANETDSKKLELLLKELIRALEDRHEPLIKARAS